MVALISLLVVAIFAWQHYIPGSEALFPTTIDLFSAILAGLTFFAAGTVWIASPPTGHRIIGTVSYMLLILTSASLIIQSGGLYSPYLSLWVMLGVGAGLYGLWGNGLMLALGTTYLATASLEGDLGRIEIIGVVLVCSIPLMISASLWRQSSENSTENDSHRYDRDPVAYKKTGAELNELAGKSEVVISAIGDGVLAVDSQGIIQLINPAAKQLLGWDGNDALTLHYKSVFHLVDDSGTDLNMISDPVQQVLNNNQEVRSNKLTLQTRSDKQILISLVVSPVGDPGSGVIIVFRDITKETMEERQKAEFISTASHEMRTPVASIEGYLGLALNPQTATLDAKARDFITKAHQAAEHLGRLFQDLLDVSKAEDGRLSNNPKVVDVVEFVKVIVEGLQPKAKEKNLKLIYKPSETASAGEKHISPVYYVNLDNDHIREIVSNLVENGIKYTLSGSVTVDVTSENDRIVVSIADTGIGIPAEDIPHLFQKFYRVDNSDTREIGGTGLGLYLCRRLAETMGGRVRVTSQYKRGSTFYVELPRVDTQEARRLLAQEAAKPKEAPQPAQPAPLPPVVRPYQPRATEQPAAPQAAQSAQQPVQPPPPPKPKRVNIPLSSIEQNPTAYMRSSIRRAQQPTPTNNPQAQTQQH